MRLSNARDRFGGELTFPVERGTVLETLGDVEIEGLTDDPETVGDVLDRTDAEEFHSADDLYDTVIGTIKSEYVGRRFYDDRGSNAGIDIDEVSF